jgi:hypothetical protein
MSNRYARILSAGGAAVLVASPGVPAALAAAAANTWTVQPGGAITATSGNGRLTDIAPAHAMRCFSLTASGTLSSGSGLPGADDGSLSAGSFACAYPITNTFEIDFYLHARGLPWHVNLSSYNAATGVVRGTISHIAITVSTSPSGAKPCTVIDGTSATADDGQVVFRYTDSTGQLTVLPASGNLHYYDVRKGSICDGLFHGGGPATLSTTFAVSPKQAITSP